MDGAKMSSRGRRSLSWLMNGCSFGAAHQPGMVTLAEREAVAVLIGRELKSFLLQEHVAGDPFAQPSHNTQQALAPCCPKCHGPGKSSSPKKKPPRCEHETLLLEPVVVLAAEPSDPDRGGRHRGDVPRALARCSSCCRVVFFSALRRSSEPGDGGRAGSSQGQASAGEQASLSRGERRSAGVGGDRDQHDASAASDAADRHGMGR